MTSISYPPLAIVEEGIPNAKRSRRGRRTTKIRGVRAGTKFQKMRVPTIAVTAESDSRRSRSAV